MGNLKVGKLTKDVPLGKAMQVEMDYWSVSWSEPLATIGALPCMNVVVHDRQSNRGGLTHVWNTVYNKNVEKTPRLGEERHELYHKVCFSVLDMMRLGLNSSGPFDIWLGAGREFHNDALYVKFDSTLYDFPEYITKFMQQENVTVNVIDNRTVKYSGDVVYWPALATVYPLVEQKNIFAVQTGKRSHLSGKCR